MREVFANQLNKSIRLMMSNMAQVSQEQLLTYPRIDRILRHGRACAASPAECSAYHAWFSGERGLTT